MTRRPAAGTVPLARALSKLGLASRAEAGALIRAGRVAVAGRAVTDPAMPVVPERLRVSIDGRPAEAGRRLTLLLNKPRGYVTTTRDPEGRPTVMDLVADCGVRVVPVGRLDLATSGLLLCTNDTRFANWVTDPENRVPRVYAVTVRGALDTPEAARLEAGIDEDGERLAAAKVEIRKSSARETHLLVTLTEGRNREVRRLFDAVGHEVTRLSRVSFGGLVLGRVQPGCWREVSSAELKAAFPGAPVAGGA